MKLNAAGVVAVVALVALAGCTGFAPGNSSGASPTADTLETDEPTEPIDDDTDDDGETGDVDDDSETGDAGVVRFYISDEENAISEFRHLNVTISEVGLQQPGDAEAEENDTTPVDTETAVPTGEDATPTDAETKNETADESDDWVEYDVDDRTFDLTQLQGATASLLDELETPDGSYSKVFVHVEEIDATLENGESANVKLPSEKLQINQEFTVEANDTVDFVFDITVKKAGNSGKYILTPVISESGPDVPIEDVDDEREEDVDDEREDDDETEEAPEDAETELDATLIGPAEQGTNATLRVTANGSAVANATVVMGGDVVGVTDGDGQVTVAIPEDRTEIEIEIESGDADAELEIALEDETPA